MSLKEWIRPGWIFYVAAILVFYVTAVHADGGALNSGLELVLKILN